MADPFLVHRFRTGKAATHAIVIGVGDYPHLRGGTSKHQTINHEGMKQLTSPPISARKFASWLIESFKHPDKPLATVSLLLSERKRTRFINPDTKDSYDVARANADNAIKALGAWKERGDGNAKNLMLFFFSGHGLAAGDRLSLPLADYGNPKVPGLLGALDFNRFVTGMSGCNASEQCYFVDACRTASDVLTNADGAAGFVPIESHPPDRDGDEPLSILRAPVFYSTTKEHTAYSVRNQPSIYTEALLDGLQNLGAEDRTGPWRVNTIRLFQAIDHLMGRRSREFGKFPFGPPTANGMANIELNRLPAAPQARVYVKTEPETALGRIKSIECMRDGSAVQPKQIEDSSKSERVLQLPTGYYEFTATFEGGRRTIAQKDYVRPIDRPLTFKEPPKKEPPR